MNLMNCCCCPKGSVDIAVLVDSTGSMASFISAATTVFEVLTRNTQCKWLVADFKDIIDGVPYSTLGINVRQNFTFDISLAAAAVASMSAAGGGDSPEQGYTAIKYLCDNWVTLGGRVGNPRMIFVIADAPNHNGGSYPTRPQVETALATAGVILSWISGTTQPDVAVSPDNLAGSVSYLCGVTGGDFTVLSINADSVKRAMCAAIQNAS